MSKTVLITGASSGIGKAAAKLFLKNGYVVFAGARRLKKMKDLEELGARVIYLDVTDEESCEQIVRQAYEHTGRIDILINNAGYGEYGPVEAVHEEKARYELDTLVFGAVRMMKLCVPLMREQGEGRIVNISSAGGRATTYLAGWYHAGKYALEALSDAVRMELEPFGIRVAVIEPGAVQSGFGEEAAQNLRITGKDTVYEDECMAASRIYRAVYGEQAGMLTSPDKAARVIYRAAVSKRPRTRYLFGFGSRGLLILHTILPQRVFDRLMRAMFSEKIARRFH